MAIDNLVNFGRYSRYIADSNLKVFIKNQKIFLLNPKSIGAGNRPMLFDLF